MSKTSKVQTYRKISNIPKGNFKSFRITQKGENTGVFERISINEGNENNISNNNKMNNGNKNIMVNNNQVIMINLHGNEINNDNNIDKEDQKKFRIINYYY